MRTLILTLILATLAIATPAIAAEPDFTPSPEPSRIVLNPPADPSTGQLVTWRTDALTLDGKVEYQPAAGGPVAIADATVGLPVSFLDWTYTAIHHTAKLSGLAPGTEYRYRVGTDDAWSAWFTFTTARSDEAPWTLMYFGDAQNNLDVAWRPIVEQAFARTPGAKVALHAGDLINRSSNDDEWGYWFAGMDGHTQTINQFPVTGNHEKSGDALGSQFREHFATAGNGPVAADSTVYFTDYQGVRIIAIDGNGTALFEQVDFLESALATNPNPWSIVAFHQPIFSGAEGRDNPLNRFYLQPILKKYNVDLVLQGHDHVYARGILDEDLDPATGHSDGSVYTVSVAGPKYYELAPAEQNNWNQNGAVRQLAFEQTSTYQPITFDGNTLTYRSYIAAKGEGSTAPGNVGDLLDAFTITRLADGTKVVADGETPPPVNPAPTDPQPNRTTLKVRGVTRNPKIGTVKFTVVANAPGKVTVGSGKNSPVLRTSKKVKADVPATLKAKLVKDKLRQLRRKGHLKLKLTIRFDPWEGSTRQITKQVVLKSKRS